MARRFDAEGDATTSVEKETARERLLVAPFVDTGVPHYNSTRYFNFFYNGEKGARPPHILHFTPNTDFADWTLALLDRFAMQCRLSIPLGDSITPWTF